ncbi:MULTISPECIES: PIN domain-containing protein [Cyanophyceae]|uniref:PIN domain-containing protein n=1 Tax=Cyanophyceae TaxID=3028117 RepID=UPI00059DB676|nr:PIN domain-containing protein [Picosynechococcus sp. OG1]
MEENPIYTTLVKELWDSINQQIIEVYTSELSLMETLVVPLKFNNIALINAYNNVVCDSAVYPIPIILSILKFAAQLRAKFKVQTPDAIHLATAIASGCDIFLTNDFALQKIPDLNIEVLVLKDFL